MGPRRRRRLISSVPLEISETLHSVTIPPSGLVALQKSIYKSRSYRDIRYITTYHSQIVPYLKPRGVVNMNRHSILNLGAAASNVYELSVLLFYPVPAECKIDCRSLERKTCYATFLRSGCAAGGHADCIPGQFSNDPVAIFMTLI